MEKKTLDLYDGNYIKFKQDGKDIAVLILRDESPSNPRRDWDNPDTMVCFIRATILATSISTALWRISLPLW